MIDVVCVKEVFLGDDYYSVIIVVDFIILIVWILQFVIGIIVWDGYVQHITNFM